MAPGPHGEADRIALLERVWGKAHRDDVEYLRVAIRALRLIALAISTICLSATARELISAFSSILDPNWSSTRRASASAADQAVRTSGATAACSINQSRGSCAKLALSSAGRT